MSESACGSRDWDGIVGNDLPADSELCGQEIMAVVAQLPRNMDELFVQAEVEIARLTGPEAIASRFSQ